MINEKRRSGRKIIALVFEDSTAGNSKIHFQPSCSREDQRSR